MVRDHNPAELEDIEIELLLEGIYRRYGFDFRQYAPASLKRRVSQFSRAEGLTSISSLRDRILHDADSMERFLLGLSVNVTALFRDPSFFLGFRELVVPMLRTYPSIRVWIAGCSTGEEAYSMAILLHETGIYDRCQLYATDMNEGVVRKARDGIFPLAQMREYTTNYLKAGGERSFSDYYVAAYDRAQIQPALKRNILFAQHNLATDGPFNEFHVILCRNVMIYFAKPLQERVHGLLYDSLVRLGFLALGSKESLRFSVHERDYEEVEGREKIYRRIG